MKTVLKIQAASPGAVLYSTSPEEYVPIPPFEVKHAAKDENYGSQDSYRPDFRRPTLFPDAITDWCASEIRPNIVLHAVAGSGAFVWQSGSCPNRRVK